MIENLPSTRSSKRSLLQFKGAIRLLCGSLISLCAVACENWPPSTCDFASNQIQFINYQDSISLSSPFRLVDAVVALDGENINSGVRSPDSLGFVYLVYLPHKGGVLRLELFKDAVSKVLVDSIIIAPVTGSGCSANTTDKAFRIIWKDSVGSDGYHTFVLVENASRFP